MTQDKVTTATPPSPDDTPDVLKDAIGAKEELRKQIEEGLLLVLLKTKVTINKMGGFNFDLSDDALDNLLSLIDKYCETREVEAYKKGYTDGAFIGAHPINQGHQKGNIENG